MDQLSPQEIALEIIQRNAKDIDVQSLDELCKDIAQAIQAERDALTRRIQIADLQDGDAIFISCPGFLSDSLAENIKASFKIEFPQQRLVLLNYGMSIDRIVRPGRGSQ